MDPTPIANGLAANPLAWGLAIALVVIAYLYRKIDDERRQHGADLVAAQNKLIETLREDAKEQREILSQIVPLATRLTEAIEIIERLTDALTRERE